MTEIQKKLLDYYNNMSEDHLKVYKDAKSNLADGMITIEEFASILRDTGIDDWYVNGCVEGYYQWQKKQAIKQTRLKELKAKRDFEKGVIDVDDIIEVSLDLV